MIYKVWIHIEQIDESTDHYVDIGLPYEAGVFDTEADADDFIKNELLSNKPDEKKHIGRHRKKNLGKKEILKTATIKEQCQEVPSTEIR